MEHRSIYSDHKIPGMSAARKEVWGSEWDRAVKVLKRYDFSGVKIGCTDKEYQREYEEAEKDYRCPDNKPIGVDDNVVHVIRESLKLHCRGLSCRFCALHQLEGGCNFDEMSKYELVRRYKITLEGIGGKFDVNSEK